MMAQQIACDICGSEQAAQMLTNLETGEVLAMGPACMPVFYGQSVLQVMDAGEHKGLPQKCQACRRIHEQMTLIMRPAVVPPEDIPPATGHAAAGGDGDDPAIPQGAAQ